MSELTLKRVPMFVEQMLETHPELIQMANVKDYEGLNTFFLNQFASHNREEFVWEKKFQKNEAFLREAAEINDISFEVIKRTAILLTLHRRLDRNVLANMLKHMFDDDKKLQQAITKMEQAGLLNMHYTGKYVCDKADELSVSDSIELDLFQSNPPLLVSPKGREKEFYRAMHRGIWSKKADGTKEVPFAFLRAESSQKYKINYWLWSFIQDSYQDPEKEDDETNEEYKFRCMMEQLHHARKAFFIQLFYKLGIEDIWFLNFFDYRGRNYPVGYLFNPQGTDADKGLLMFEPEPLAGERAKYWLQISIANQWNGEFHGKPLDKQMFEVRKVWYDKVIQPILENTPRFEEFFKQIMPFVKTAESPACFLAQVKNAWEIERAEDWGITPFVYVITHWDHTASGYQYLGILSGDQKLMKITNLRGGDSHYDCYTIIYQELIKAGIPVGYTRNQVKKGAFVPGVYGSEEAPKKLFKYNRELLKIFDKVMNTDAGWRLSRTFIRIWDKESLEYGFHMPDGFYVYKRNKGGRDNKWEEVEVPFEDGVNVTLYKEKFAPNPKSRELGPAFIHSLDGFDARETLRRCFVAPNRVKYLKNVLLQSPKVEQDDPQLERMQKILDQARRFNFYSLRILEELTPSTLSLFTKYEKRIIWKILNELPEKSFQVSEIHDSFGVLPNYTEDLMKQKRLIMASIAKSKYLKCVLEEYLKTDVVDAAQCPEWIVEEILTQGRIVS